ncbi:MAG: hypothetical protein GEU91_02015 [Rhizobiales bacterium]|nr:hypothetical protein [Hyphomicrobiales bacterium]
MRIKAALALALLYASCALAPSTALAFMDSVRATHGLTDTHGAAPAQAEKGQGHTHRDGAAHRHAHDGVPEKSSEGDGSASADTCCGLFCASILAITPEVTLTKPVVFAALFPALDSAFGGRGPDRIIRPPIA